MKKYNFGELAFHLGVIVIGFPLALGAEVYDAAKRWKARGYRLREHKIDTGGFR